MQDILGGQIDAAIVLGSWFESGHTDQVNPCGKSLFISLSQYITHMRKYTHARTHARTHTHTHK